VIVVGSGIGYYPNYAITIRLLQVKMFHYIFGRNLKKIFRLKKVVENAKERKQLVQIYIPFLDSQSVKRGRQLLDNDPTETGLV